MTSKGNNLGRVLKQRRLMAELALRQLSAFSGVSSSHLDRIERGERFPSARTLHKIAEPLGISESELFTFAGYLSPQPSIEGEKSSGRQLDPYVARVLSGDPVEVQRVTIGILSILRSLAGSVKGE